jgi:hypothetical protein
MTTSLGSRVAPREAAQELLVRLREDIMLRRSLLLFDAIASLTLTARFASADAPSSVKNYLRSR